MVGETEAVRFPQLVEIPENIGRRLIVVGHPGVKGQAGAPQHGFRRDP